MHESRYFLDLPLSAHRDSAHQIMERLLRKRIENLGVNDPGGDTVNRNVSFSCDLFSQGFGETNDCRFFSLIKN